ncbi:MAG TPA: hypothetical protein PLQ81_11735, partial [bacterium]|nr:hypothetical protein [bacterium]
MKIKKKFTDAILFKDGLEIEILDNITSLFGIKLKSNNAVIFGFLNAGKIKNLRDSKIIIKYIERHSAAGQLPGSSNLEENVHSQKNSIIEKKITRQISPLLKLNKFNMDIELNLLLESGNSGYPSDSLAMNCAMILSYISGIIDFPYYTGRFCSGQSGIQIEPGFKEINRSKFSVLISWTSEKLIFLEASGREFSEYQIENIKRIIETGQSGYFEFLKDLKNESGIDLKLNGVLSEDADFDIKRSIENIILANKELIEGIYVYDSYKTRIEELTKLSSILLKNAELSTDINIKNFDEFKNYYFYSFYRILLNIVKENLNQKKRLYDDYANKITDIEIEITKNKNTSVCRINRKVTDAIVSVTSLRQKEENSEEGQQVKRTKNKIEKFVKINDDVDFRSESKFYNISNFFGNNINVLL